MSPRIVLITGANSGVGYATTKVLASISPDFHIIMSGRSLTKLEAAKSSIEASGTVKGTLSTLHLDVTDDASITNAFNHVETHHNHLDILINNAALGCRDPDLKTRLRLSCDTNVIGPMIVAATMRPLLLKSSNPYSIFVSSGAGSLTSASNSQKHLENEEAYRMSKAALNMLAVIEHRDFGSQGLKVFTMCPGFVVSNLRGTDEESRTGWGNAKDAETSGRFILSIVRGERDGDVGRLIHDGGVYPW